MMLVISKGSDQPEHMYRLTDLGAIAVHIYM